jgi:hypothetical protein
MGEDQVCQASFVDAGATLIALVSLRDGIDLPEDAPNPAVGAFGNSDGEPTNGLPVVILSSARGR